MSAHEWLMRGWRVNREIEALLRIKRETFEQITAAVGRMDGVPVKASTDPHKFDRYVELEDLIDRRVDELVTIKREIVEEIKRMDDERHRTLLLLRYVNFEPFSRIAEEMNYSYVSVMRLHRAALGRMQANGIEG